MGAKISHFTGEEVDGTQRCKNSIKGTLNEAVGRKRVWVCDCHMGGVGGQGNKQAGSSRIKSKPDLTVDPASSDRDWYTQFSSPEVTVITMCPSESF